MRVFIGFDEREERAAEVAAKTLHKVTGGEITPEFLKADKLADQGLLTRISDHRGGQDYDLISNASKSTRFATSRFLTPILCQEGYALFCDCDVVFLRDPREMLDDVDPRCAVSVVKHDFKSSEPYKMVNQKQVDYDMKLWSSVMLFQTTHPANRRLTLWDVNNRRGLWLHQFGWLNSCEIGSLDPMWNVLVGDSDLPAGAKILHWTLGGPFTPGWKPKRHDEIWLEHAQTMTSHCSGKADTVSEVR